VGEPATAADSAATLDPSITMEGQGPFSLLSWVAARAVQYILNKSRAFIGFEVMRLSDLVGGGWRVHADPWYMVKVHCVRVTHRVVSEVASGKGPRVDAPLPPTGSRDLFTPYGFALLLSYYK